MKRFTLEETQLFLDLYEQEECLWDVNTYRTNKTVTKRKEARRRIAEAMCIEDFNEESVRQKFRSLRQTYIQEKNKRIRSKESGATGDNVYQSNLCWLSQMQRLLPGGGIKVKREGPRGVSRFKDEDQNIDSISEDSCYEDNEHTIENCPIPNERIIKEEYDDFDETGQNGFCENKDIEIEEPSSIRDSPEDKCLQQLQPTPSEDEIDLFGKYIAAELKTLKPRPRLLLQKEMFNMILNEKLKHLS